MSSEKTESVKISKVIMDEVREMKKRTGLPLIRIVEHAISQYTSSKPVTENRDGTGC
jgi:hypothetical protein